MARIKDTTSLTREQHATLLRDIFYRGGDRFARQTGLWVVETHGLATAVVKGAVDDWAIAVFWIRLFGVMHDLRGRWREQLKVLEEQCSKVGEDPRRFAAWCFELAHAADAVVDVLTEDERIFTVQAQ